MSIPIPPYPHPLRLVYSNSFQRGDCSKLKTVGRCDPHVQKTPARVTFLTKLKVVGRCDLLGIHTADVAELSGEALPELVLLQERRKELTQACPVVNVMF